MSENQNERGPGLARPLRVGAVSFFNTRTLIYGLENEPDLAVTTMVPAKLAAALEADAVDVALLPSIDYQQSPRDLVILPAGVIGSLGEVLTVRVFSRRRPDLIDSLSADPDSHTSVALAQIIWQEHFGKKLEVHPLRRDFEKNDAILLIGDKVLPKLGRWEFELDLGTAWRQWTHLPFVYAVWAAKPSADLDRLMVVLARARQRGTEHIDDIVARHAAAHGFEPQQARRYLAENLHYQLGPSQQEALLRFYEAAHRLGLTPRCRPLRIFQLPPPNQPTGRRRWPQTTA
jgi:chorismate dehydratase